MTKQARKILDCRVYPNENGCTLTISGTEQEVMKISLRHAVEDHGHKDTPELRKQIKIMLENECSSRVKKIKNNLKKTE